MLVVAMLASAQNATARPNILFMMADQMRFDALGAVNPQLKTPALNKLASEGLRFAKAYSATPTCTPARASLLTGLSPWYHGMLGYGAVATKYAFEHPRALADAGYLTHSIGKDHFGWNASLGLQGGAKYNHAYAARDTYDGLLHNPDPYHEWFGNQVNHTKEPLDCWPTLDMNSWRGAAYACDEYLHPTAWAGREAAAWLSSHKGPEFLLKVSFHRPHSPYDPPQRLLDAVSAADVPPTWSGAWSASLATCYQRGTASDPAPDAWCGEMPADEALLGRRAYHASIRFVDEQVAKIDAAMRSADLLESTVWLFTADHGDGQGDHFHWRKGYPYEFSAHVPLIVRWPARWSALGLPPPARPRGAVATEIADLSDVAPTLLHAAGLLDAPTAARFNGSSLLCVLANATAGGGGGACGAAWRTRLALEHATCYNESNHWSALVEPPHKYVFNALRGDEQLFDLGTDPRETTDLAADPAHAATLARLRGALAAQYVAEGRGEGWVKAGKLVPRPKSTLYSPNYPGGPPKYVA